MDLIIREAVEDDDGPISDLLIRAFTAQYAKKMPELTVSLERIADLRNQAQRRQASTVLVAETGGDLVGTVALYEWGAHGGQAWINGAVDLRLLAVDVAYQGRGLSSLLLDECVRRASIWRARAICLHVRKGVRGVSNLYEARGFQRDPAGDLLYLSTVHLEGYALVLPLASSDAGTD